MRQRPTEHFARMAGVCDQPRRVAGPPRAFLCRDGGADNPPDGVDHVAHGVSVATAWNWYQAQARMLSQPDGSTD